MDRVWCQGRVPFVGVIIAPQHVALGGDNARLVSSAFEGFSTTPEILWPKGVPLWEWRCILVAYSLDLIVVQGHTWIGKGTERTSWVLLSLCIFGRRVSGGGRGGTS
jgi:hypothetical protein